ncbi:ABC transporter substrate-binding protein [Streptomyces phytohabitans]|uniref:ABC transporter substrate-binding protein n=1 Tax=Streptomyces phytohabitans TaxID=1150371 RepID=UPI00345B8400
MTANQHEHEGFPDDRAMDFVLAFPTSVAPEYRNRADLSTSPPLFLLRVPESAYVRGADRLRGALRASLDQNGKLAPVALLPATGGGTLLSDTAGVQLMTGAPEHMTPDAYPHFHVVRDLVTYVRSHPDAWLQGPQTRNLRQYASERRAQRGGPLGFTRVEGPALDGLPGFLVGLSWLSFVQRLPKWLWARRTSRKVMRGWLGAEQLAGGGRELFRVMDVAGGVWSARLLNDPQHPEALQELDRLLFRALLEDLRTPAIGRFRPGQRRRTARPVLLVDLPPSPAPDDPDQEEKRGASRAAERFLRAVYEAQPGDGRHPGPLVVAVGCPSGELLAHLGEPAVQTLAQASQALGMNGGDPVLVDFTEEVLRGPGLHVRQVKPRTFRFSRRVPAALTTCLTVLALLAAGVVGFSVLPDDRPCVGGSRTVDEAAPRDAVPVDAEGWYEAVVKTIDEQNSRAEQLASRGRVVRTVVAFGSNVPTDKDETPFDGTIQELRGIAMWQEKLLSDAESDNSIVPLRVEVRPTGRAFAHAEREAEKVVAEVKSEPGPAEAEAYTRVVGALGYAQSRTETRRALQVLGREGVPTIGTTATADEMLDGYANGSYWPFTPPNSVEGRIAASFASSQGILAVGGSDNTCAPAKRALIVESSTDLYSHSLAGKFRAAFPGPSTVFDFSQEGDFSDRTGDAEQLGNAPGLARALCQALAKAPDSVVYWTTRARDFTAFINSMNTEGTCLEKDITVLGGNELTNVAQTGAFADKDWLRLYYSAHRQPESSTTSEVTRKFVQDYTAFVKRTTKGVDPWPQDGHSAVSYDAFHALSQAVDRAYGGQNEAIDRESVLVALRSGSISFNGATGYVSYSGNANAQPVDKALFLLRQIGNRPETVLQCGAYAPNESTEKQGAPCDPS